MHIITGRATLSIYVETIYKTWIFRVGFMKAFIHPHDYIYSDINSDHKKKMAALISSSGFANSS